MLKLVRLEPKYRPLLNEMMDEWTASGEKIIPWSIRKCDYRDFDRYLASLEVREPSGTLVPDSTFFCLDTDRNRFIGAVNIQTIRCFSAADISGTGSVPANAGKGSARR